MAVLLGAALLGACTESKPASPAVGGIVRPDVFATAPEPRGREWTAAGTVGWPVDLAGVRAIGARVTARPREKEGLPPILQVLPEEGRKDFPELVTISLSGTFDTTTFNRLVIPCDSVQDAYVHCTLLCRGVPLLGSTNRARISPVAERRTAKETASGDGASTESDPNAVPPAHVVIDLPGARKLAGVPDELQLIFDNVRGSLRVGSIELYRQPIWGWLPAIEDGFGMVAIGDDSRPAVGVSTARTLETEVEVPADARLRFSVGIPKPLRLGGARSTFRVEVHAEGRAPLVQTVPLERDLVVDSRWHAVKLPLDGLEGRRVRIVFSFGIGGPREAVCAMTRPRIESSRPSPRTVLLVTSDTHRGDALGAMAPPGAAPFATTPALDALAARGMLFEDCWSSTNVTIPSHVAIMTGISPRDSGVFDNFTRLSRDARTIAEEFQDRGFATYAAVSAPHLADDSSGLGQGFDRLCAPIGTNKRRSDETIVRLAAWIEEADGQDLFVWLHLFDAHTPYEPPAEFERKYWPEGKDAFDPTLPEPVVPSHFQGNLPAGVRDLGLVEARYRGEVSHLDRELAGLFRLPRIGAGVIAVTADHGESLGEHGIFFEHEGLYPQSIHVPLILAGPGVPRGERVREPVSQLDLARTLLELAGVEDAAFPGASLLARTPGASPARFAIASSADRASVTKDGWHLIVTLRGTYATVGAKRVPQPTHHTELYDLSRDPACLHDLAATEVERARDLRALLCRWFAATRPTGWAQHGAGGRELQDRLAQLGYVAPSPTAAFQPLELDCACARCAPFRVAK